MHVNVVGINYQTAPVSIRERIAVSNEKMAGALALLHTCVPQGVILSTCNRTEIYSCYEDGFNTEQASLDFLNSRMQLYGNALNQYVYILKDWEAVQHLFRVSTGLESLIVGEYEVLGQVRQSLEAAEKAEMVNLPLRHIFNSAIRVGRNTREETEISKNALSVSSVAVEMATKVVGDLTKCKMLIIGTGEAGNLVAKVAKEKGTGQIGVASRTKERAEALAAPLGGKAVELTDVGEELCTTDILITSAGAPHRILDREQIEKLMQKRPERPLVIIDIAVPRNVEPEVAKTRNIVLYNIDDLTEVSNTNRRRREDSIQQAEKIIAAEVDKYISWWQDLETRPVICALMSKAEKIRSAQLSKTLKSLPPLSGEQQSYLEAMTKSIVNRILQDPINYLKNHGHSNHSEVIKQLFQLDTESGL